MPKVSVIVPCYNHGQYIDEAIDSVLAQTLTDYEIVIVNDGSTDEATNSKLAAYDKPKTRVLQTANSGLAATRNNGIRASSGEYILPLDADDRIGATYLEKAVAALDARPELGIVYCKAEFFGEVEGEWHIKPYSFPEILWENRIFCSGVYRRSDWEQAGGYDPSMTAFEDHDFWLSIIEFGRDVYQIPEVLFYYRQHADSMRRRITGERAVCLMTSIARNHTRLYAENIDLLVGEMQRLREELWHEQAKLDTIRNTRVWRARNFLLKLKDRFDLRTPRKSIQY